MLEAWTQSKKSPVGGGKSLCMQKRNIPVQSSFPSGKSDKNIHFHPVTLLKLSTLARQIFFQTKNILEFDMFNHAFEDHPNMTRLPRQRHSLYPQISHNRSETWARQPRNWLVQNVIFGGGIHRLTLKRTLNMVCVTASSTSHGKTVCLI